MDTYTYNTNSKNCDPPPPVVCKDTEFEYIINGEKVCEDSCSELAGFTIVKPEGDRKFSLCECN